jgi:hypothetical protein
MGFAWVSENRNAPELGQIQPFSFYLDLAKCNFDGITKAAWVRTRYKCVAQNLNPVPLPDRSIPNAGLDCRGRAIPRTVPIPGPRDKLNIPQFSPEARGGMGTTERLPELWIGSMSWPNEKEALLVMLANREYAPS